MPIKPGNNVPSTCTGDANKLQTGVLFTFKRNTCPGPSVLAHLRSQDKPTTQIAKLPLSTRRGTYTSLWNTHHLAVCDTSPTPTKFAAKKASLLKAELRDIQKCPFNGHLGVRYRIKLNYLESINPFNTHYSPIFETFVDVMETSPSHNGTYQTVSIGDPYMWGSAGVGQAQIEIFVEDSDPDNACSQPLPKAKATLISVGNGGTSGISGGPGNIIQERNMSCIIDNEVGGFWTCVRYPSGPIGIVMSLGWNVRAIEFID